MLYNHDSIGRSRFQLKMICKQNESTCCKNRDFVHKLKTLKLHCYIRICSLLKIIGLLSEQIVHTYLGHQRKNGISYIQP